MNQEGFGIASGMVWAMSLAAASFGVLYALLVARLQRAGLTEGYTSFLVVLGVLATLAAAIPLVGIVPVLIIIWLFVCSGVPMIIGDVLKYTRERKEQQAELLRVLREGDDGDAT